MTAFFLRPATIRDSQLLYRIRIDPEVVVQSAMAPPDDYTSHRAWLVRRLGDLNIRLYVAQDDGKSVGTGRLDWTEGCVVLSIAVSPAHRGKGYAGQIIAGLLAEARAHWPGNLPVAYIKSGNTRSLRAFISQGFTLEKDELLRCVRW